VANRVKLRLAKPGRIFQELELFAAALATEHVVVIAGFFAHEVNDFDLLLALRHDPNSSRLAIAAEKQGEPRNGYVIVSMIADAADFAPETIL